MSQMKRSRITVVAAAERLRAGEPLASVAKDAGITPHTLMDRLGKAGFSTTGHNRSSVQRSELKTYLASALLRWHEPWMAYAACAYVDPEAWFPERGASPRDAKAICATCPVVAECREFALRNKERWGVWGQTTERERRRILKGAA